MFLNSLIAKKNQFQQEKKKGFTLVELLVVIAIIAILATVSTVGYLGFTKQAKISNDLTELTQYKTIITGNTLEGYTYTEGVDSGKKEYTLTYETTSEGHKLTNTSAETLTNAIAKTIVTAILGEDAIDGADFECTVNNKAIESISYYHHYDVKESETQKYSVKWDIATDTVSKLA